MTTIHVTASRDYDVLVQPGLLDDAGAQLARVLGTPSQSVISSTPQPPPPRLPSFQINRHSVLGASVTISRGLSPSSFVHLMSLCITDPHQNYFSP